MSEGVIEALQRARALVCDISAGRKRWTMQIPANHNEDTDVILIDAIDLALETIRRMRDGQ